MKTKRMIAGTMCAVALLGLTACSSKEPKTAQEVVDAYTAAVDGKGYSMDGQMEMNISMRFGEELDNMEASIPMSIAITADSFGEAMHGILDISTDAMGETASSTAELYTNVEDSQVVQYMNTDGDGWVRQNVDVPGFSSMLNTSGGRTVPDGATFEKVADTYVVTEPLAGTLESEEMESLMQGLGIADPGVDYSEILKDAVITTTYDAESGYLLSMDLPEFNFDVLNEMELEESTEENQSIDASSSITLSMRATFSNYGEVTADSVAVPATVAENASPATAGDMG